MKKLSVILVLAIVFSLLSLTASAATQDPWGPHYYTPQHGEAGAFSWGVAAINCTWSAEQVEDWYWRQNGNPLSYSLEIEFRPNTAPIKLWDKPSKEDFVSNFPAAYYQFEDGENEDDVSVCSAAISAFDQYTSYYGIIWLDPKENVSFSNRPVTIESELGLWLLFDSLPLNYEQYPGPTYFGNYYSW